MEERVTWRAHRGGRRGCWRPHPWHHEPKTIDEDVWGRMHEHALRDHGRGRVGPYSCMHDMSMLRGHATIWGVVCQDATERSRARPQRKQRAYGSATPGASAAAYTSLRALLRSSRAGPPVARYCRGCKAVLCGHSRDAHHRPYRIYAYIRPGGDLNASILYVISRRSRPRDITNISVKAYSSVSVAASMSLMPLACSSNDAPPPVCVGSYLRRG